MSYQGIDKRRSNFDMLKLRVGAGDGNAAVGPGPFYHSALGDCLEYELTFNVYSRVIKTTDDTAARHTFEDISLE